MNEYIAMWQNYANFSDRTSVRGYWMAVLFNFLASAVISIVVRMIPSLNFLSSLYALAVLVPSLAIAVRRLRDAGYRWTSLLWFFLPVIGWIIVLLRLCKKSAILEAAE